MKIVCIRETKIPEDNRVALTPEQIVSLQKKFPTVQWFIQKSNIRSYKDQDYEVLGIPVIEDISDCDIFLGVKEVNKEALIPNKHYIFYGHIAKEQPYNQGLIKDMINKGITFSDYELFVNENGKRLIGFGWWAGVVGAYNTIRAYGIKTKKFDLAPSYPDFTFIQLKENLARVKHLLHTSIIITGNGQVSKGVQYVMGVLDGVHLSKTEFVKRTNNDKLYYTVLTSKDLVKHKDGLEYNVSDFKSNGHNYVSCFDTYARSAEILITAHFWDNNQPVYVDDKIMKDENRTLTVIGDITCDIKGSVLSTVRSTTHNDPFYDFNPLLMVEEPAFSKNNNITIMAVDTCPNALALDASEDFGNRLSQHILPRLIMYGLEDPVIKNATILKDGKLTTDYLYLSKYAGL